MNLYQIQGKAVGSCTGCGQVRACRVHIRPGVVEGEEILLCKPCRERTDHTILDRELSLSEARGYL